MRFGKNLLDPTFVGCGRKYSKIRFPLLRGSTGDE